MDEQKKRLKLHITLSVIVIYAVMAIVGTLFCSSAFAQAPHNEAAVRTEAKENNVEAMKYALIAASVAFGLGAVGAGIAISHVGAAAMGAVAEKPQIAGQALIFVALAEGIVVFGFITALMILGKV